MTVFSLVGPIASGKTTIIDRVSSVINKLPENYIELDRFKINNKLILSKWAFINSWFQRILECHTNNIDTVITDRCPYDAIPYANKGNLLFDSIRESFQELYTMGIFTRFIYIRSEILVLHKRISSRITRDLDRLRYHELDQQYLEKTISFYESNANLWDFVVDNNLDIDLAVRTVTHLTTGLDSTRTDQ